MIKYVTVKEFSEFSKFLTKNFEKGRKLPTYCKQTKIYDWRYFMNYDFTNTQDYIKFLSNLREGVVGNQATMLLKFFLWKTQILTVGKRKLSLKS